MKKFLFVLITMSAALSLAAQNKISEGKIVFGITYPEITDTMKQLEDLLPRNITVYVKNDRSRTEMPSSAMGMLITVSNTKSGELLMMMELMNKKLAIRQTAEQLKKQEEFAVKLASPPEVKVMKLEGTKTIAGYVCKRAVVEVKENGEVFRSECYYTDKLPKMKDKNDRLFKEIDGFIMEYSQKQSGILMTVTAKTVTKTKVPDTMFEISPEYKVITQQELEKMISEMN